LGQNIDAAAAISPRPNARHPADFLEQGNTLLSSAFEQAELRAIYRLLAIPDPEEAGAQRPGFDQFDSVRPTRVPIVNLDGQL
jgi:hypothetical protein